MPMTMKIHEQSAFHVAEPGRDAGSTRPREAGTQFFGPFLETHGSQPTELCEIASSFRSRFDVYDGFETEAIGSAPTISPS